MGFLITSITGSDIVLNDLGQYTILSGSIDLDSDTIASEADLVRSVDFSASYAAGEFSLKDRQGNAIGDIQDISSGDMLKSVYDPSGNGIVDDSENLNNQPSSYYLSRANHSGTQPTSSISNWETEVSRSAQAAGFDTDTKTVKVSNDDTTPGFLNAKIAGTTNKVEVSVSGSGDEKISFNIGSDVFDKAIDTTDNLVTGSINKFSSPDQIELITSALGTRWQSGFSTTANAPADDAVDITGGVFYIDSIQYTNTGSADFSLSAEFAALASGERQVAELYINETNIVQVVTGPVASGNAKADPPAHPANSVCIAYITLIKNKGTIETADISPCTNQSGQGSLDTDELVKITPNDTTAKYLNGAFNTDGNITFTISGSEANESLEVNWNGTYTGSANITGAVTASAFSGDGAGLTGISADGVQFVSQSNPAYQEAELFYDWGEHALAIYNDASDMTHQLGQEFIVRVYNNSGAQINNGQIVYTGGAETGENRPTIGLANASGTNHEAHVLGFATHDIPNNSYGYVTMAGIINDIDTSGYTLGDDIYLSATTAGGFTATPPNVGTVTQVGHILKVDANTGRILVHIESQRGSNFIEAATSLLTTSAGAWVTRTISSITDSTLFILINNSSNGNRTVGVRAQGSSLGRLVTIGRDATVTMPVRTNSSGQFEIYSSGGGVGFNNIGSFK